MSADTYVLVVPAPCSFVNSNDRGHWAVKYKRMRAWKERAAWAAKAAHLPTIGEHVHITATVHRDHNRGRWDVHNLADTAKAAIDGLVVAGVLADDSNRHVTGPDMRPGDPWADAALVLTITVKPQAAAVTTRSPA